MRPQQVADRGQGPIRIGQGPEQIAGAHDVAGRCRQSGIVNVALHEAYVDVDGRRVLTGLLEHAGGAIDRRYPMSQGGQDQLLAGGDLSVTEIAAAEGEKMTTVSARLQILHAARLIARRRRGKSVIYSIADDHVLSLVENAVAHAGKKH